MFEIPAYREISAMKIWEKLIPQVGMLRLNATSVHNLSGRPSLGNNLWRATPEYHFQYTITFQPQLSRQELKERFGCGSMSFNMGIEEFSALNTLLQGTKEKHRQYLDGHINESCHFEIAGESASLCFATSYILTSLDGFSINDDKLKANHRQSISPLCNCIEVYVMRDGEKLVIGHLTLHTRFDCMAGLILEAERLQALLDGASETEVRTLTQMPTCRAERATDASGLQLVSMNVH